MWEHTYDAAASTGAEVLLANPLKVKLRQQDHAEDRQGRFREAGAPRETECDPRVLRPVSPSEGPRAVWFESACSITRKWKAIASHTYAVLLQKGIPYPSGDSCTRRRLRGALRAHNFPELNRGLDALENASRRSPTPLRPRDPSGIPPSREKPSCWPPSRE